MLPRAKHALRTMRYLMSHFERVGKEANYWEADSRMWMKAKALWLYDMVNHFSNTNTRGSVDFMNWLG